MGLREGGLWLDSRVIEWSQTLWTALLILAGRSIAQNPLGQLIQVAWSPVPKSDGNLVLGLVPSSHPAAVCGSLGVGPLALS